MIGKKIPKDKSKAARKSTAGNVVALTNYIADPSAVPGHPHEKLLYRGSRQFISDNHYAQQAEMVALACEAVRSTMPVSHYLLSWKEGEHPTPAQFEEAVDIVLEELGLQGCQAIFGAHDDTENIHMHIAVNRVDPVTLKVRKANRGFDIEAMHRAVARIEALQGWEREKNGRYQVIDETVIASYKVAEQGPPAVNPRIADQENISGEKSAQRLAIEEAGPIVRSAKSWREVHDSLAAIGMRFERFGSGAKVFVGEVGVKASDVDRKAGMGAMEKRLGIFEPASQENPNVFIIHTHEPHPGYTRDSFAGPDSLRVVSKRTVADHTEGQRSTGVLQIDAHALGHRVEILRRQSQPGRASGDITTERGREAAEEGIKSGGGRRSTNRAPEPLVPDVDGWPEYIAARYVHYETKEAATLALRQWHNTERSVFANEQAKYRATVLSRSWINGSGHRNLIESAIAYERAIKHAAMQERRALERMQLRQQYRPFPSLEQWQRQRGRADLADAWRNRASEPMQMTGPKDAPAVDPLKHDIRDFVSQIVGYEIHYSRANGKPEFIDWGDRVDVNAWRDRDVTFAAMQLGMAKWGEVCVIGSDAYKTLCINIAAQHGLKISNPELQDRIEAEGIRLRDARALAVQSEKFNDAETAKRNDADHTTPTSDFSSPSI